MERNSRARTRISCRQGDTTQPELPEEGSTPLAALASDQDQEADGDSQDKEDTPKVHFWETPKAQSLRENPTTKDTFEHFWFGSQHLDTVKKKLSGVLDETKVGMEAILAESIIEGILTPFLKEYEAIFGPMESKLGNAFQKNTQRRRALLARMEQYNTQWKHTYRALTGRVEETAIPADAMGDWMPMATNESGATLSQEEDLHDKDEDAVDGKEAPSNDHDWDDLFEQGHKSTVDRMQRYHVALIRLEIADDSLQKSLREIQERLKASTKDILQIVADTYDPIDDSLDYMEAELQYKMVHNFERRQANKKKLKEKGEHQQNLIARLMAKLQSPPKVLFSGSKRKGGPGDSGAYGA